MPWKETQALTERIDFVVKAKQGSASLSSLCREFGISRKTGYKWLGRYDRGSDLGALEDRSRRPRRSPNRTPEEIESRVVSLWRELGWGARKLRIELALEGLELSRSTIQRILDRRGLRLRSRSHRPALHRFERSAPNELVQMDFKGQYPLANGGYCFPLCLLDDHSRFNLGLFALTGTKADGVLGCLRHCFREYGVPESLLLDHGTPWWSPTNGHGLTRVSVWLIEQGVDLVFSGVGHPQTQGKIERFNRTLDETLTHWGRPTALSGFKTTFKRFRSIYNHRRPHEALDMKRPDQRYQPSPRPFRRHPQPWTYPSGVAVARLNKTGCLDYQSRRHFVCEALAHRDVGLVEFDGRLLVTYRQMQIREIDLSTGKTRPMVKSAAAKSATSFQVENHD